jgi:uncharacterized damage-inducible protein DinB
MDLRQHTLLMARYQGWASQRLFEQVDTLDDETYRRENGLFFGSVHRTLNHLLLADHIWHGRMIHQPYSATSLNEIIEDDRARLRERIIAHAGLWHDTIAAWDDATFAGIAEYQMMNGTPRRIPRATCVLHVFNHGTHHRGQVSAALTQLGASAPEMDLPYFLYSLPGAEIGLDPP